MSDFKGDWYFPGNRNGQVLGLNNGGIEWFADNHIEGLARESVQNSIDARRDLTKPVRVVFDCFDIDKNLLPNMGRLESEIDNCIESCNPGQCSKIKRLNEMKNAISDSICCLRISDYNTKGLEGVQTDEFDGTSFCNLVRGDGESDKGSNKGGSKGVGKNATFVNSSFRTVFYSTLDLNGKEGYIGLARLCSAKYDAKDAMKGEQTTGIGYYSYSSDLDSIPGQLDLGRPKRKEPGTDIYILGFMKRNNWKNKMIAELLDSFMCAFYYGCLDVEVDKWQINQKTLKKLVFDKSIVDPSKTIGKKIIMQYYVLTKKSKHFDINLGGSYKANLYFLDCEKENTEYASQLDHNCFFVRSPYMKVNERTISSRFTFVCMCIIDDNDLNNLLRDLENVQHNKWGIDYINDDVERKQASRMLKLLYAEIDRLVDDQYVLDENFSSELAGTAEFIPLNPGGNAKTNDDADDDGKQLLDEPYLTSKKTKNVDFNAQFDDPNGEGVMPEIGSKDEGDLDDALVPDSHNNGNSGGDKIGNISGNSYLDGNERQYYKHADLSSVQRYLLALDPDNGQFAIIVKSPSDFENVRVELNEIGASDEREKVNILEASLDNTELDLIDHCIVNFLITSGAKQMIYIRTDRKELFAGEVKIYED